MTVRNISVFGQCQKCKATFTLELAVSGGAILEIDPYRGISFDRHRLKHIGCGGDIKLFNVGGTEGRYVYPKPAKYRRERRKSKKKVILTETQAFKIILALPGEAHKTAVLKVEKELQLAGQLSNGYHLTI